MAMEVADIRYFDFAIQTITSIPVFQGDRSALDAFITQMDAACAVAAEVKASEPVKACLGFQFLNRISPEVQQAARISVTMSWAEARARLRDQYGGMLRPLTRHAWKAMTIERARGERESEYAHRLAEEMRLLKRRVLEAGYSEVEIKWRLAIYEEMAVENLRRNLTENTRKAIMAPKIATVEEATRLVEDEEAATAEYKAAHTTGQWIEVKRRPRMETLRPRAGPRSRPVPRREPAPRREPVRGSPPTRTRPAPREFTRPSKSECWACGESGHFKRECPYVYHREKRAHRGGYEPMEVNTGRWMWKARSGDSSYTSSDDESIHSGQGYRQRASFADVVREKGTGQEKSSPVVEENKAISQ